MTHRYANKNDAAYLVLPYTTIRKWFAGLSYDLADWATRCLLIARHRPLLKCPVCEGRGGAMSGYYEPEWSECTICWHHWEPLADYDMNWFAGRLPVLEWFRARVGLGWGMGTPVRLIDRLHCEVGLHDWVDDNWGEERAVTCSVCGDMQSINGERYYAERD